MPYDASPLPRLALWTAAGLLLVAVVAWLVPASLAASHLVLFGRHTLAGMVTALHAERVLLLGLAVLGGGIALLDLTYLSYVAGLGFASALVVGVEVVVLIVTAPMALFTLVLLVLNLSAWLLVLRLGLGLLRLLIF